MSGLEPPFDDRDRAGMGRLIEGAGNQVLAALERTKPWEPPASAPDLLAVGAMGGSAIAADLTAAVFRDRLPRPMFTVRDYRLPASVTRGSLVLLSSYSGETEETLSLAEDAAARGVPWMAITTGGSLGERCRRAGAEWRTLPEGMPPRAALYASWVAVTRLLAALGWIDDPVPAWRSAAARLQALAAEWAGTRATRDNAAKRLAESLNGRFVFLYAEQRLEPLAVRWRNQLNENAKLLAHSCAVPELNHNEIVGWEREGGVRGQSVVVLLRDGRESADNEARFALTAEALRRGGVIVVEPPAPEGGPLERAASLALLGDFVSYYLAMLGGVDPTPIASLDEFKRRLAARRQARQAHPA